MVMALLMTDSVTKSGGFTYSCILTRHSVLCNTLTLKAYFWALICLRNHLGWVAATTGSLPSPWRK